MKIICYILYEDCILQKSFNIKYKGVSDRGRASAGLILRFENRIAGSQARPQSFSLSAQAESLVYKSPGSKTLKALEPG